MVICLERCADLHMVQLMPLPLTVSCFSKIQIGLTFLVPAHPGNPGQRAIKRARVCVYIYWTVIVTTDVCVSLAPHTHTHTHPFNGPLSRITWVSRYQRGKTNLDFTEARDSEWQWHQLGMCKSAPHSRQITTPAPHHSVFTGRMPFLPPNQQRQSTEGH